MPGAEAALSQEDSIEFTRLFFDANREKILGNYNKAAELFAECLRKNPRSGAAMYELSRIYIIQGRNDQALYFARGAAETGEKNIWYQLFLAEALEKNKKYDEAIKVYQKLRQNNPSNALFYERIANTHHQLGDYRQAVAVYDDMERRMGINEDLILKKERLYILMNQLNKAVEEVQKLIATNPSETRYYHLLADLYMANNMDKEAMDVFRKLLEVEPFNPLALLAIAKYYREKGEYHKIFDPLKNCFEHPDLDVKTKSANLNAFYPYPEIVHDSGRLREAVALAEVIANTHRNDAQSGAVLADYLYHAGDTGRARENYRSSLQVNPGNFYTWRKLLAIESEMRDYRALHDESTRAIELFPDQPVFYLFCGIALIHLDNDLEAIRILQKGIKLSVSDSPMLTDFYANLGDTYYKNRDTLASYQAFDKALQINPDNSYVLNNYSFYLVLRGENLEKARKMAERAVTLDPENFSFLDTYGWVMYRLGKYDEAKKMIESALEKGGSQRPAILEHYGDVMFKLGDRQKAVECWEKAKSTGKGSGWLEKKIADKILYE